tara:strand:- start:248 stop:370 length:123 start_codon:yes stop_codon:yes gene_type:complete
MSHEVALIEAQFWAFEEKVLYAICCLALFALIGLLFKVAK